MLSIKKRLGGSEYASLPGRLVLNKVKTGVTKSAEENHHKQKREETQHTFPSPPLPYPPPTLTHRYTPYIPSTSHLDHHKLQKSQQQPCVCQPCPGRPPGRGHCGVTSPSRLAHSGDEAQSCIDQRGGCTCVPKRSRSASVISKGTRGVVLVKVLRVCSGL